ncbi:MULTISPECIES: hypothetical protein [Vibrio]|uniref:Uncharacterized protein n=1 Tax=Vibrio bivalvicida TaxID=1276888 RepID=A0A177Y6T5_9VIBR|nr:MULTISPECIES: hypothetical protein [Vibrio]KLN66964.1 hypothetical protein ZX61_01485 [Vibrio sp. VPAP30]OAJ96205.1 hypothetical protein APB76_00105 [Vibrio bivalvicida]
MNRKVLAGSIASGLIIGALAGGVNSPTITQAFQSETSLLVKSEDNIHLIKMKSAISLKRSGQYEMFFLTEGDVGFNSAGEYHFTRYGLSLMPTTSEQVLPSSQQVSLLETMFSQRGMHSLEELKVIPYSQERMILVAPRYSYLFSKRAE